MKVSKPMKIVGGLGAAVLLLFVGCCSCGLLGQILGGEREHVRAVDSPAMRLAPVTFSTATAAPVLPTNTPALATATPIPPTAAPVAPPTDTPIPATDTPAPSMPATDTPTPPTETPLPATVAPAPPVDALVTPTPEPALAQPTPTTVPNVVTVPEASCDCSANLYNCKDFTDAEAQGCYLHCLNAGAGDVHELDRDSDGNACEWGK